MTALDEGRGGGERGRLSCKQRQRANVGLARSRNAHDLFIHELFATELQLRHREPDGRVEPDKGSDYFLAKHPQPVAARDVQQLVADDGALRVDG